MKFRRIRSPGLPLMQNRQICLPGADLTRILFGHPSDNLRDMIQIMHCRSILGRLSNPIGDLNKMYY